MTLLFSSGTVAATNGSSDITFTGAGILPANAKHGDEIRFASYAGFIDTINYDAQTATISPVFDGTTASGISYAIRRATAVSVSASETLETSVNLINQLNILDARGFGLMYKMLGNAAIGDPGVGKVSRNSASWASTTSLCISLNDATTNNVDRSSVIDHWGDGTLLIVESIDTGAYAAFTMTTAPVTATGFRTIANMTYVGGDGPEDGENIRVIYVLAGVQGKGLTFDDSGNFAGRAAHDTEAKNYSYLSLDGDGDTITTPVVFVKQSATSGDWSVAIPVQGPQGFSAYQVAVAQGFSGTVTEWLASLVGPKGDTGNDSTVPGPPNSLSIGTVTEGAAAAEITGTAPDQTLNLTIPKGDKGDTGDQGIQGIQGIQGETGPANSLSIGTVDVGTAAAAITGTAPAQTLNLTLPKADAGWTAVDGLEVDGERVVRKLVDYTGGTGTKPTANIGSYYGSTGFVTNIADAIDERGAPGTGSLDSVNGDFGPDVILDADDISDTSTTHKFATAAEKAAIAALGTASTKNTGTGAGNVPLLDGSGKLDTSILPGLAIVDVFTVEDQTSMLALAAQQGDIAIRTDLNKCFALSTNSPSTLADWKELLTPVDAVLSVAGLTGAITASALKTALGLDQVDNTTDADKPVSTATQTALDAKADTTDLILLSQEVVHTDDASITSADKGKTIVANKATAITLTFDAAATLGTQSNLITNIGAGDLTLSGSFDDGSTSVTLSTGQSLLAQSNGTTIRLLLRGGGASGGGGSSTTTVDVLTGDGGSSYSLSVTPSSKNAMLVFEGGIIQDKANFSISGTSLTMGHNVAVGTKLIVWIITSLDTFTGDTITWYEDEFTGSGSATFTLGNTPVSKESVLPIVGGVPQPKGAFSLSGTSVTFGENVPSGVPVSIRYATGQQVAVTFDRTYQAYAGSGVYYTLPTAPPSNTMMDVIVGGILQPKDGTAYSYSGTALTLASDPGSDLVEVSIFQGATAGVPNTESVGAAQLNSADKDAILTKLGLDSVVSDLQTLSDNTSWRRSIDVILEDQKAAGTEGGTFTSGADQTRTLNTVVYDPNGYATLASNQFTLPAGTWFIKWDAPAVGVNHHQSRLYNVTDAVEAGRGSSAHSGSTTEYATTSSKGSAVVAIAASKTFSITHRAETSRSTDGFGTQTTALGIAVYTHVEITKVA